MSFSAVRALSVLSKCVPNGSSAIGWAAAWLVAGMLTVNPVQAQPAPISATGFGTANLPFDAVTFAGGVPGLRGPRLATVWGNPAQGPHGFFVRLPGRWESGFHIHPHTYHAVVLQGTAVNNYPGQRTEVPLTRGGYFATLGGVNHTTRCLSEEDCLFYVQMDGPFGAVPPFSPPGEKAPPAEPADIKR
jgi:beta-alanine degradation protein BauB